MSAQAHLRLVDPPLERVPSVVLAPEPWAAAPFTVFWGQDFGGMLVANERLKNHLPVFARGLDSLVEKIKAIA